jgi:hypothetical protein
MSVRDTFFHAIHFHLCIYFISLYKGLSQVHPMISGLFGVFLILSLHCISPRFPIPSCTFTGHFTAFSTICWACCMYLNFNSLDLQIINDTVQIRISQCHFFGRMVWENVTQRMALTSNLVKNNECDVTQCHDVVPNASFTRYAFPKWLEINVAVITGLCINAAYRISSWSGSSLPWI